MMHGDLSNRPNPVIVLDFDGIIDPPPDGWRKRLADWVMTKKPKHRILWPFVLRWFTLNPFHERWAWWVAANPAEVDQIVAVRGPDSHALRNQVKRILKEGEEYAHPCRGYFAARGPGVKLEAAQIQLHCEIEIRAGRFYTRDPAIAYYLPRNLCQIVIDWSEMNGF